MTTSSLQNNPMNQLQGWVLIAGLIATLLALGAWKGQIAEKLDSQALAFQAHIQTPAHPQAAANMSAVKTDISHLRDGQQRILDKLDKLK